MPICEPCKNAADRKRMKLHKACVGHTACFCQHKSSSEYPVAISDSMNNTATGASE